MAATGLTDLYTATSRGEAAAFLDAHPELVTREVADRVRQDFRDALDRERPLFAQVAAATAALIYQRLGDMEQSLINHLDFLQIEFMKVDTLDGYRWIRDASRQAGAQAADAGLDRLVFHARVLAADCAYFAAQAAKPPESGGLSITALRDVVDAVESIPEGERDVWFERLISLLGAVAGDAMGRYWSDAQQLEVTALLRRLARAVDRAVPVDYAFSQTGGAEKTSQLAAVLTRLADEYG